MHAFLKCLGAAFLKHGVRAVANLVPLGGAVYDIAVDVWDSYGKVMRPASSPGTGDAIAISRDLQVELRDLVEATREQLADEISQIAEQLARDRSAVERHYLEQYLSQVPQAIRQSCRRPSDPTGRTVPGSLKTDKPEDLIIFLPPALSRFQPGQKPLPGLDLELVELLGVGGFGEVWKAQPRFTALPPVALKFCLDPAAKDRLLHHEARVLNQVMSQGRHPGIVELRATYLSAEMPFLEYEYVGGGDLAGLIAQFKREGRTDPLAAAEIIADLAQTVGFMHRLQPPVVHRDLKPANILIHQDKNNRLHFKIADFGIGAVIADREVADRTRRPTGYGEQLTIGLRGAYTMLYASPQQMAGKGPDPRDDVHALGVIWHQLMTGDLLRGAPTGQEWKRRLLSEGMASALVDLLESCCDSEPEGRPVDAMDLAKRIAKVLAPAPPAPLPSTPPQETNRPRSRLYSYAWFKAHGVTLTPTQGERLDLINPDGPKQAKFLVTKAVTYENIERIKKLLPPGTEIEVKSWPKVKKEMGID